MHNRMKITEVNCWNEKSIQDKNTTIAVLIAVKKSPKTNLRASTGFKTMASHSYTCLPNEL